MNKQIYVLVIGVVFGGVLLTGCRGYRSEKPPIHPNPNFDWQAKVKAQKDPQPVPTGTVPWGDTQSFSGTHDRAKFLKEDTSFYHGKDARGAFVAQAPITVSAETLTRGQERYNIYCAACHDQAGTGKGLVVSRGLVPPPDFADPRIVAMRDGELFSIISHGVRTMPAYGKQIGEEDRWTIVVYLRALQLSRNAKLTDVPEDLRATIK